MEDARIPSDAHAHRRLLTAYLRPERRGVAALGTLLVVGELIPLAGPLLLRRFVDQAVGGASQGALVRTAVAYISVGVVTQVLAVAVIWAGTGLAWRATDRIRADAAAHALSLDLSWHGRRSPGELIERIDGDVTAITDYFSQVVLQTIGAAILIAGVVVLVFLQDWRAGATVLAFSALAAAVLRRIQDRAVPAATVDRAMDADAFGSIEERLAGLEDLRANGGADHALRRFQEASAAWYQARNRAEREGATVVITARATFAAGTVVVLALGAWLHRSGAITVGTVFLLFQSMQLVRRPLEQIAHQLRGLQKAGAGASRVAGLLALRPRIVDGPGAALPGGPLAVTFDHVTFAYGEGAPVLRDFSLAIAPGQIVGVVGRTGSGKTTLMRLLIRLYDADAGHVGLGGVDVRQLTLDQLRRSVGVVTQDVQLFEASLRDNLTLFGDDDDHRLVDVLGSLGLASWFGRLPNGLDTVLGASGTGLSAGEAQLLAFARVFLHDPAVVVLDEAASRLDPGSEHRIGDAVDRLLAGRTGLVIAHRASTLERADRIVTITDGAVVERGAATR